MKRILLITSLLAVSLLATSGCTKTSVGDNSPTPRTGDWKITYYYSNSNDKTDDYAGYVFDFKPKNAITATVRALTVPGVWAISTNSANQKMNINFNTGDDMLSALSNDWYVTFVSETQVELKDNDAITSDVLRFTRQ